MPGGNMTFGAYLQNAKMHLTEAIMDLKSVNARGALMELNLTDQGLKMTQEMMMYDDGIERYDGTDEW